MQCTHSERRSFMGLPPMLSLLFHPLLSCLRGVKVTEILSLPPTGNKIGERNKKRARATDAVCKVSAETNKEIGGGDKELSEGIGRSRRAHPA